jgi:hypothetical protein
MLGEALSTEHCEPADRQARATPRDRQSQSEKFGGEGLEMDGAMRLIACLCPRSTSPDILLAHPRLPASPALDFDAH